MGIPPKRPALRSLRAHASWRHFSGPLAGLIQGLAPLVLVLHLVGCLTDSTTPPPPGESGFDLAARYSFVRSHPGGGGVFLLRLDPEPSGDGNILLSLSADPSLHARLDRRFLNAAEPLAELTLRPDLALALASPETCRITVTAVRPAEPGDTVPQAPATAARSPARRLELEVELIPWIAGDPATAILKRDELLAWVIAAHPELSNLAEPYRIAYQTYPSILVVEHWTFLGAAWEIRVCWHVTIPPYDWSMIRLRRRGDWEPLLAACRDSDGTTYEIPVSEYPTQMGY
jgi:hypothetical protein